MFSIRRLRAAEWRDYRALRLRALGDSPNAFGSTMEIEQAKPDEYWVDRLSSATASRRQLPLVAETSTGLVGLVWGWIDPSKPAAAHIFQMWVAPEVRNRGCGALLVDAVVAWAREAEATSVTLRATCGDTAAKRLYERAGFKPIGAPEPLRPGATIRVQPMELTF